MNSFFLFFYISLVSVFFISCGSQDPVLSEENDPAYERGRSFLKTGKESEALDQFLSVTRRVMNSPKSHLEVGRLFLTLKSRKDPFSAIYHFRRFLFLNRESKESEMVKQLIMTAEKEIIRELPGEPYSNYLNSLTLKEENERQKIEIADLKARLGLPVSSVQTITATPKTSAPSAETLGQSEVRKPVQAQKHVVQKGDSLYAISRKFYGDSSYIDFIFQANRSSLPSKNSLKLGQVLIIPPKP